MSDWSASIVKELDAYFFGLGVQEAITIGSLVVSLASLCLAFVLVRRWRHGMNPQPTVSGVEPSDGVPQRVHDVAATQEELRALIREFSALAAQVLRTVDRNHGLPRLPDAGGAASQLLDLGLSPAEAARATGMTIGEVALLMNLRKAKASTPRLPARSSSGPEESTSEVIGGCGKSDGRPVGVNGDGRQAG